MAKPDIKEVVTQELIVYRLREMYECARKDPEYANGYNSGAFIQGRLEGMALAIAVAEGNTLAIDQWCANYYDSRLPKLEGSLSANEAVRRLQDTNG